MVEYLRIRADLVLVESRLSRCSTRMLSGTATKILLEDVTFSSPSLVWSAALLYYPLIH